MRSANITNNAFQGVFMLHHSKNMPIFFKAIKTIKMILNDRQAIPKQSKKYGLFIATCRLRQHSDASPNNN